MISRDSLDTLLGATAYSMNDDRLGRIEQIYLDTDTGQPEWVIVRTGLFASNESFVPLERAELTDDGVRVPYDKDRVKEAPSIETDRELSEQDEDELYSYYGVGRSLDTTQGYSTPRTDTTAAAHVDRGTRSRRYDASAPNTDNAMTRSEERVRTDIETRETGRARLRKYVVSEQQQVTVPVTREQVRVEREPISDANYDRAMDGPALSEEEHEVVLNEERPVLTTEAVPVERVRLAKDQVRDEQTVNVDVRKEQTAAKRAGSSTAHVQPPRPASPGEEGETSSGVGHAQDVISQARAGA